MHMLILTRGITVQRRSFAEKHQQMYDQSHVATPQLTLQGYFCILWLARPRLATLVLAYSMLNLHLKKKKVLFCVFHFYF